jgi:MFS transporter, DHA2 family, methylenomycin A resistance protein
MTDLRRIKRITLGTMCFALFMVMLDSTVVNLALPTIQRELNASMSELQWIVDAFVLALASLLLTGGTLGDMFGRRRAFMTGVALFTVGSVICALAPSTGVLIAARLLQGVGGAVMMPSTLSILTNTFPDARERARAIGIWAGVSGLALAVGPLVGGWLVDNLGWQSIFWINVPIGAIALGLAARFVPESSDRADRGLDLAGQVTAILGLAALTYAFIEANNYGWTSARILTSFVVAGVSLAAFLIIEVRGRTPLLQLRFFRNLTFSGANLVGVIVSFGFFGVVFYLSLFMQNVQGYSPTEAGVLQLPSTLGVMTAAIISGRIVGRIGARLPITLGLLMGGTALLFLTGIQPETGYASFWYWLLLMGLGIGLIMSPMTSAIMGTVPAARAGMASATSNTMRQVGSVFGIAVLGNIVTHTFTSDLKTALTEFRLPPAATAKIMAMAGQGRESASGHAIPGVDMAALGQTISQSFTNGLHAALWVSGILLLVGAPIAYLTVRYTAPHHVEERTRRAAQPEAAQVAGLDPAEEAGQ